TDGHRGAHQQAAGRGPDRGVRGVHGADRQGVRATGSGQTDCAGIRTPDSALQPAAVDFKPEPTDGHPWAFHIFRRKCANLGASVRVRATGEPGVRVFAHPLEKTLKVSHPEHVILLEWTGGLPFVVYVSPVYVSRSRGSAMQGFLRARNVN